MKIRVVFEDEECDSKELFEKLDNYAFLHDVSMEQFRTKTTCSNIIRVTLFGTDIDCRKCVALIQKHCNTVEFVEDPTPDKQCNLRIIYNAIRLEYGYQYRNIKYRREYKFDDILKSLLLRLPSLDLDKMPDIATKDLDEYIRCEGTSVANEDIVQCWIASRNLREMGSKNWPTALEAIRAVASATIKSGDLTPGVKTEVIIDMFGRSYLLTALGDGPNLRDVMCKARRLMILSKYSASADLVMQSLWYGDWRWGDFRKPISDSAMDSLGPIF